MNECMDVADPVVIRPFIFVKFSSQNMLANLSSAYNR